MNNFTDLIHTPGYKAPSTLNMHEDKAQLLIGDKMPQTLSELFSSLPFSITLELELQPVFLHSAAQATLFMDATPMESITIYQSASLNEPVLDCLKLKPKNSGFFMLNGNRLPLDHLCFYELDIAMPATFATLKFAATHEDITEYHNSLNELRFPPLPAKQHILHPYGGVYKDSLEACEQLYFGLSQAFPQKTSLEILKRSQCKDLLGPYHLLGPHIHHAKFQLDQLIHQQALSFSLKSKNEHAWFDSMDYIATAYTQKSQQHIDLTFIHRLKENL